MSSDNLRTLQPEALAALQKLMAQSPSVAALQMQLAQGQLYLGNRSAEVSSMVGSEQFLVFSLENRELAVKAEHVQGVERLVDVTPVPNVAPWVKGVINLRGSIVSVVDLRQFLDLNSVPFTPSTRLLSLQYNDMVICFVVDAVSEMVPLPASALEEKRKRQEALPSWIASYASGGTVFANRTMMFLDVPRLLFSEKMQHYGVLL